MFQNALDADFQIIQIIPTGNNDGKSRFCRHTIAFTRLFNHENQPNNCKCDLKVRTFSNIEEDCLFYRGDYSSIFLRNQWFPTAMIFKNISQKDLYIRISVEAASDLVLTIPDCIYLFLFLQKIYFLWQVRDQLLFILSDVN